MRTMRIVGTMAATLLLVTGCAGEADPQREDAPAAPEPSDPDGAPEEGDDGEDDVGGAPDDDAEGDAAGSSDAVLGDETMAAIDAVVGDGVDRDDVEVVEAAFVTWPDSSLGCPEPGMMYTQALVEGFRIVLDVAGDEVAFHGDDQGRMVRCDDPQPPVDETPTR